MPTFERIRLPFQRSAVSWRNSTSRYGSLSIALRWLMPLIIAAVYSCIELRGNFRGGIDLREGLKTWHFMLGLSVLVLVVFRAAAPLNAAAPRMQPDRPWWSSHFAKLMHVALHVLMIGMPLMGWLILSAERKLVPFFGMKLPPLGAVGKSTAGGANEPHEAGGKIGCFPSACTLRLPCFTTASLATTRINECSPAAMAPTT